MTNFAFPSFDTLRPDGSRRFAGPNLLQISMPMGGIGAGCVCLNGIGGLDDFAIRNRPATSAAPPTFDPPVGAFATLRIEGASTKLVEGPMPVERIYDQGIQSEGFRKIGHEGLPRFRNAEFTARFPFGTVHLSDPKLPIEVEVEGWNPFVPLDDVNSGLPCTILEYRLTNTSAEPAEFEFSFHATHLARGKSGDKATRNAVIPHRGVSFTNVEDPADATFGSGAIALCNDRFQPEIKAMWFRGGWFDSISALWREVSTGTFKPNDGTLSEQGLEGNNGGSVLVKGRLEPNERVTIPVVLAWHFPNCDRIIGQVGDQPVNLVWHPFYSSRWVDATAVVNYVLEHHDDLYRRTHAFADALFSSTIDPAAMDAVASNLAILKSPTVLRQASGNLWCWEGCCTDRGCCHGSCTHVWNYAQAIPHLFPSLERTLREQEFLRSMDGRGHVNFRSALPDAKTSHDFHGASDGQLGGILKVYREWQISGDRDWLSGIYALVKRSLDYCISIWDPDRRGALFEPHHNTYDIEFWGPDGMCSSIYVGALCAMALIARELGFDRDAEGYEDLAASGGRFLDEQLFNGEYYEQRVMWEGLRDTSFARLIAGEPKDEMEALLKSEGPKYQYGVGCISDGVIGAWMAKIYGVETPLSREHVRSHLRALFEHNFKPDLSEHACTQRPGYALGEEPGLLLCTWPRGGKPTLPFVYSDEVWTGIEYQVATHMIEEGLVEQGLALVRAVRSRYEGHVRNPFNEYECGSYYARAMASYAILGALSGFRYSAASKALWLDPKVDSDPFRIFFSTVSGFGTLTLTSNEVLVEMVEGQLAIDRAIVRGTPIEVGTTSYPDQPTHIQLKL